MLLRSHGTLPNAQREIPDNAFGVSGMMRWMAPFHGVDAP